MYLSEILADSHTSWQPGTTVFIEAPTGLGKTTYILKRLLPYAIENGLEILYLSNRQILHKELIRITCNFFEIPYKVMENEKIAEFKGITFLTYQTFQKVIEKEGFNFPYFHYIVADEIHYIFEDAAFNPGTGILQKWLDVKKCSVFIAISATITNALPYLGFYDSDMELINEQEFLKIYVHPPKHFLNKLRRIPEFLFFYSIPRPKQTYKLFAYSELSQLVPIINNSTPNEKWLIFQANKEKAAQELLKKISTTTTFLNAEKKGDKTMNEIVTNNQFSTQVLITTKVLDNGVNICDSKIKNVVLDTISQTDFLQMLGRRRHQDGDESVINLYLPIYSAGYFSQLIHNHIDPYLSLLDMDSPSVLQTLWEKPETLQKIRRFFYLKDNTPIPNPIAKDFLINQKKFCKRMLKELQDNPLAFLQEQLVWLTLEDQIATVSNLAEIDITEKKRQLITLLETYANKEIDQKLQVHFRKEIAPLIIALCPNQFSNTSRTPGLNLIKRCLKELQVPFNLESVVGKKKGAETKWIIKHVS